MGKRNAVVFSKPEDPKFLKLFKQDSGYKEGPTVNTKREGKLEDYLPNSDDDNDDDDDDDDVNKINKNEDEKPQVVVLKSGDLTAEEAETEQKRLQIESEQKPANLNEKIIFKSRKTKKETLSNDSDKAGGNSKSNNVQNLRTSTTNATDDNKMKSKNKNTKAAPLSFSYDDDDEDEDNN